MSAARETEWARRQRRERERAEHVAAHGPACQICGNVPKRGLDQDHDHRTGKTRGWLCHRCNRALPSWVNSEWLIRAAFYLAQNPMQRGDLHLLAAYLAGAFAVPEDELARLRR